MIIKNPINHLIQSKLNFNNKSYTKMNINFFGGNPLNRNGPSRERLSIMRKKLISDNSKVLLFNKDKALFQSGAKSLYISNYQNISGLFHGIELYNENIEKEGQREIYKKLQYDYGLILIYLGFHQSENSDYFALQLNGTNKLLPKNEDFINELTKSGNEFLRLRPAAFGLKPEVAAIVSQARAILDWHSKSKYCPSCGSITAYGESGYKRICLGLSIDQEIPCTANNSIQNFSYPRTDAVGIVCVISKDGEKILLGRKSVFPKKVYSCVAGFFEPGESLEEAIQREVLEETGVVVDNVKYISSQPWPFPSNLMIGCHAYAVTEEINKDDEELEDAKWFTRQQVLKAIGNEVNTFSFWSDPPKADSEVADIELVLPTKHSIAYNIIVAWANNSTSHL
ncbi:hypothetical protein K502DRAFT_300007 [Neoconidiobolus thromboides FSU 785]|nr:hypothetical protein K502DRAFT_300007 [Neoconidiobolus thromboides FSU 785]